MVDKRGERQIKVNIWFFRNNQAQIIKFHASPLSIVSLDFFAVKY
ncbi:MAG: hypothetical protein PWQ93_1048, partial [Clostridiales bacterium]|nr:hypothetical protein [Clostridiales bacterium]